MLQVKLTHSEQLKKHSAATKNRLETLEYFYLMVLSVKMTGDALELLKKPTVHSQEERSKILERNQDQNVARTECLQNLDQVHDEIESKENAKRQSHYRTFEGQNGGEDGAEKEH